MADNDPIVSTCRRLEQALQQTESVLAQVVQQRDLANARCAELEKQLKNRQQRRASAKKAPAKRVRAAKKTGRR